MAGITDHVYRLMLRRIGGVGLVTMEFISSEAITRGNARQRRKMLFSDEERPLSIQIYGSDPERMAAAADIVEELGPDVCDINMGCPANKVLKGCAGAALMGDLPLAREIVRSVKKRLSMPLTVKFRLGLDDRRMNFLDLGRMCEDEGVAAVAMHARTARQMYTGQADRRRIAELKRHLAIPVVGNGDVSAPDDALALLCRDRLRRRDDRARHDEEPLDLPPDRRPAGRAGPCARRRSTSAATSCSPTSRRSSRRPSSRRKRSTSCAR